MDVPNSQVNRTGGGAMNRIRFRSRASRCNGKTRGPKVSIYLTIDNAGCKGGRDWSVGRTAVRLERARFLLCPLHDGPGRTEDSGTLDFELCASCLWSDRNCSQNCSKGSVFETSSTSTLGWLISRWCGARKRIWDMLALTRLGLEGFEHEASSSQVFHSLAVPKYLQQQDAHCALIRRPAR